MSGLNKLERLAAERKAKQQDLSALLISPDFPYDTQPFDPGFFGLFSAPSPAEDGGAGVPPA
jgi:hypothetical protein